MKSIIVALLITIGAIGLSTFGVISPAHAQSAEATAAESQSATFAIENMTCALCPVTVRKAIEGVSGVTSVSVDLEDRTATVVFDPAVTDRAAISAASTTAGYPAAAAGR
ncbi:MAG: heavy-metal-associated domain-containing protein [Pseudomonadales bacterium]